MQMLVGTGGSIGAGAESEHKPVPTRPSLCYRKACPPIARTVIGASRWIVPAHSSFADSLPATTTFTPGKTSISAHGSIPLSYETTSQIAVRFALSKAKETTDILAAPAAP